MSPAFVASRASARVVTRHGTYGFHRVVEPAHENLPRYFVGYKLRRMPRAVRS